MHSVFSDFCEKLSSKFTLMALAGLIFCMLLVTVATKNNGDQVSLLQYMIFQDTSADLLFLNTMLMSPRSMCLEIAYPLIAGFTTTSLYCDKYNSKYDRYMLIRSGNNRFAISQILGIIVGSLALSMASMAVYFMCAQIISDEKLPLQMIMSIYVQRVLWLWMLLCFGGLLTLIFATLTNNKYMSLLLPVYLCYVLRMISDKLLATIDLFDPDMPVKYSLYAMIDPRCLYYFDEIKANAEAYKITLLYPYLLICGTAFVSYVVVKFSRKGF